MDKKILIAGGTDGIGFALTTLCTKDKEYKHIYVLGRNFSSIRKLKNGRIIELPCNILEPAEVKSALGKVRSLDVFVNTIGSFQKKSIPEVTTRDIRSHFELNTIANIELTTQILPKLSPGFSQILVCLATLAIEARPNYSLQAATKAAYRSFLQVLDKEQGDKIRVMMIHPSSVQTNVFQKSGDVRSVAKYPTAANIAEVMHFMLNRPSVLTMSEVIINNRI